jgi:hypothetical protein
MSDNTKAAVGATILTAIVFGVIFMILCLPIAFIWSLNVLFGAGIEITVETWLASLFIMLVFATKQPTIRIKKD